MHIPDGFLSPPVWAALDAVSLPAVAVIARRAKQSADEGRLPLLGVLGAFVFAAQMINFPVAPGASAHLLGGALLACTAGPGAGVIVMTAVLAIQALVFQDGGILALGANVFNLAIAGVLMGYLPYRLLAGGRFRAAGIFLGGAASVLAGGFLALGQLVLSGVAIGETVARLSVAFFVANALAEGLITLAVVRALERMNPSFVQAPPEALRAPVRRLGGAAAVLAGAGFLIASAAPDSLETIAEHAGIAAREIVLLPAPLAGYELAGVPVDWVAKAVAGLAGLVLVWGASAMAGRLLARRSR